MSRPGFQKSTYPCELHHTRFNTCVISARPDGRPGNDGKRDHSATPPRLLRPHPFPALSIPTDEGDKPFELVAVCLWSVVGVALTTLMIWLALGGEV
jgi:hypothetical protein